MRATHVLVFLEAELIHQADRLAHVVHAVGIRRPLILRQPWSHLRLIEVESIFQYEKTFYSGLQ